MNQVTYSAPIKPVLNINTKTFSLNVQPDNIAQMNENEQRASLKVTQEINSIKEPEITIKKEKKPCVLCYIIPAIIFFYVFKR